jgi:hypothetical protein
MADVVVDSLITQLKYEANTSVLKEAEAVNARLDQQNKATAASTDALAAEQRKLAEHTDALTRAQIDLTEEIAATAAKTDRLKDEQRELRETIEQAGGATGAQVRRLLELDEELQRTAKHARDLREENARLGVESRKNGLEARKLAREQKDLADTSRKAASDQRRLAEAMREAKDSAQGEGGAMARLTEMIGGVAGGQLAADAIRAIGSAVFELGKEIITTGANFESLRARLKTVEGSTEAAGRAFGMIQDFAKTTPFEVENITEAFTALRVRGVNPTTDKLRALGDLSSAFGLEFKDTTDAIGAAARGELDPIEKLGITAKIAGDKISLSFKGQTEVVSRSATAVTDALVKFGQMSGVQGAMAEQSLTTAGIFSNLKDTVAALFDQIAQMGVLDEVKRFMEALSESMGSEGLSQVIADVLVLALRTARELFLSLPQETLISFLQALVDLVGLVVGQLTGAASEGAGVVSMMFEFLAILVEVVTTVYDFAQQLDELRDKFEGIPGPLDILLAIFKALLVVWQYLADLLRYLIDLFDPLIAKLSELASYLPSFKGLFNDIGIAAKGFAADMGLLNVTLAETEGKAAGAFAALEKLRKEQEDYYKKLSTAELQELIKSGDTNAEAEQRRRIDKNIAAEKKEETEKKRKEKSDAYTAKVDKLLDKPGDLTRNQLDAMVVDSTLTEKQRDKAQKEIDKRDAKSKKEGAKANKKLHDSLLTAQVEKDIEKLAEQAGQREAARAIQAGATPEEVNRRELARRGQVQTALTTRFRETGELPPGITQDLAQVANLPNIEQVGGRMAPPVITVNNYKFDVTGNTFQANVSVGGTTATAGEIADAAIARARPVLWEDFGRAIMNNTTTLRRG